MAPADMRGRYRIGAVARLTGLSPHTLRMWERRYGTVQPQRSDGGDRLYSEADVHKLRLLRRLVDRGHAIGRVADLGVEDLGRILAEHGEDSHVDGAGDLTHAVIERFVDAVSHMDVAEAERLLGRAAVGLESRELLTGIIAPLLIELGKRWESGELRVSYEHAATAVLRNVLGTLTRMHVPAAFAPTAVATTPAGERHELGALMASMLAAVHGWNVVYLGPDLPAAEVAHAVERSAARMVLLSVVSAGEGILGELSDLSEQLPADVQLVLGGRAAGEVHARVPRAVVVGDLADFEDLLAQGSF